MASVFLRSPNLFPLQTYAVSSTNQRPCPLPLRSSFFGSNFSANSVLFTRRTRSDPHGAFGSLRVTSARRSFDVVIIGAGIIGLTIARQFLAGSDLSVAVVDKAVPCSGATGAGQGYIWMIHKKPGSEMWDLAMRSHELWVKLADGLSNPEEALGWKKTGSLLIGRTPEECEALKRKVHEQSEAGLRTEYLSSSDLRLKEPALLVDDDSGAALLADDSQLDAHRAVAFIEKENREFASIGRYAEFYHEPVTGLIRSNGSAEVAGVQTSKNILYSNKAVIVAAGCWSGSVMDELLKESNISMDVRVKPRKGHLVVVENFDSFNLNHGLMEAGYVDHALDHTAPASGSADEGRMLSVSMTAAMDPTGNLLLGSSREFCGFNTEADEYIIGCIWERAGKFFPKLKEIPLRDFMRTKKVRVGLRPYMPDGKPVIGAVPGLQKLFIAAGHEGGGLSLAPGTAEMVFDIVLRNPLHVDSSPFTVEGRCC